MEMSQVILLTTMLFVALVFVCMTLVFLFMARLWFKCFMSGCPLSIFDIIGTKLRRTPTAMLIDAHIALHHQNKPASFQEIESCYLAHSHEIRDVNSLLEKLSKFQAQIPEQKMN